MQLMEDIFRIGSVLFLWLFPADLADWPQTLELRELRGKSDLSAEAISNIPKHQAHVLVH